MVNFSVYEVVWSFFSHAYIIRPMSAMSKLESQFIGSELDCLEWIRRNK